MYRINNIWSPFVLRVDHRQSFCDQFVLRRCFFGILALFVCLLLGVFFVSGAFFGRAFFILSRLLNALLHLLRITLVVTGVRICSLTRIDCRGSLVLHGCGICDCGICNRLRVFLVLEILLMGGLSCSLLDSCV